MAFISRSIACATSESCNDGNPTLDNHIGNLGNIGLRLSTFKLPSFRLSRTHDGIKLTV